ncbi:FAD-dependent monooxygenase [Maricurvus nonylphenolicus]|uniref:FAD-dependent monooxygenase n=1 Tax=Maricurvus nonylphenolicus TaxID=1008307 RepID=UPI0036F27590
MKKVSVLIVGGGPLGMTASALLSQYGVDSLMVDKRSSLDNHPRARLYDAISLELFRQLGCADEIEATGLGAAWTQQNPVFITMKEGPIAKAYTREFYSVDRKITPQRPVMSCQDYLEPILWKTANESEFSELREHSEVFDLVQDENGCRAKIRDLSTGEVEEIAADYVIGADGTKSYVREVMGANMEGEYRDHYFRDVLFEADLEPYHQGHIGGLLFVRHGKATALYQPIDGKNRWRAQVPTREKTDYTPEEAIEWIKKTTGAGDELDINVQSILYWRVTAQTSTKYGDQRMYLLGDAAQIFTPTGGMGMNTAWAGAYNLIWKLAYVIKGHAPASILDTYEEEWKPQAYRRTRVAMANADSAGAMYRAYEAGEGFEEAVNSFYQYASYTGVIFGYELESDLLQKDTEHKPALGIENQQYIPIVRSGRRLPHVWIDEAANKSIYDWFGFDYVLALGEGANEAEWVEAVEAIRAQGFPIRIEHLPNQQYTPLDHEQAILIRPDRIVAAHWKKVEEAPKDLLARYLPLKDKA